jgi:hypothetical protein
MSFTDEWVRYIVDHEPPSEVVDAAFSDEWGDVYRDWLNNGGYNNEGDTISYEGMFMTTKFLNDLDPAASPELVGLATALGRPDIISDAVTSLYWECVNRSREAYNDFLDACNSIRKEGAPSLEDLGPELQGRSAYDQLAEQMPTTDFEDRREGASEEEWKQS